MVQIDYTQMFSNTDELADHLMLPENDSLKAEADWLVKNSQATMSCQLNNPANVILARSNIC